MKSYPETKTTQRESSQDQSRFSLQGVQLIWLFLGLLEVTFALRLFLVLGSSTNPWAGLLYNFTDVFLFPFRGITGSSAAGTVAFEAVTVIAMLVYAFLGWVLQRAVWNIFYRPYAIVAVRPTTLGDRRML